MEIELRLTARIDGSKLDEFAQEYAALSNGDESWYIVSGPFTLGIGAYVSLLAKNLQPHEVDPILQLFLKYEHKETHVND